MKIKEMDGTQRIAFVNTRRAAEYEVGGWLNEIYDGWDEDDIPETEQEAKEYVYDCAINNLYGVGAVFFGEAPKEMRFAGKDWIMKRIDHFFEKDPDVAEIAVTKHWR